LVNVIKLNKLAKVEQEIGKKTFDWLNQLIISGLHDLTLT